LTHGDRFITGQNFLGHSQYAVRSKKIFYYVDFIGRKVAEFYTDLKNTKKDIVTTFSPVKSYS
jgi:hypothetical protein